MLLPFMVIIVALIEFSFLLTTKIGVTDTAQDAVQLASELGTDQSSDFQVLQLIQKDVSTPLNPSEIVSVEIFKSDANGIANTGEDKYVPGAPYYQNPSDTAQTVPFKQIGTGFLPSARCNIVDCHRLRRGRLHRRDRHVSVLVGHATAQPRRPGIVASDIHSEQCEPHGADPMRRLLWRRPQRGQSLVEFAMVLPVIMFLLLGMIEMGFAINHNTSIVTATRQGAQGRRRTRQHTLCTTARIPRTRLQSILRSSRRFRASSRPRARLSTYSRSHRS